MIIQILHCPHCQGTNIVRHGQTRQGKQRYRCREQRCAGRTFLLDYTHTGQSPEIKRQIVGMALNASGIRDTARVLHISEFTRYSNTLPQRVSGLGRDALSFSKKLANHIGPSRCSFATTT
jgi:transposase-like protein